MTKEEKGNNMISEFMGLDYQDYDIDWRVLMPVWVKFRSLQADYSIQGQLSNIIARLAQTLAYGEIGDFYKQLVRGIEWYNQTKTSEQ